MTVLSAQSIRQRVFNTYHAGKRPLVIQPFLAQTKQYMGKSHGLTAAGYDIRLGLIRHPERDQALIERLWLPAGAFVLASSFELVGLPNDLQAIVHDKSSWARKGLALQNTVLEPGWTGYITLELSNHETKPIELQRGMPIAQLVFHQLDQPTEMPYDGKYQNQGPEPTDAIDHPGDSTNEA